MPLRVPVDGRPRINVGGRTYVLESRIAEGDSSVVFRGRWVVRLGERVVVKVERTDADRLRAEWAALRALSSSRVEGASHFVGRLPQPIALGTVQTDRARVVSVFGWKSGFVHTLHAIGEDRERGLPGPVTVWIWKRLLELLGFVHRSGWVHGAVTPDHILVHPYDHGATLVGWTCASRGGPLVARSARWTPLYAGARDATPRLDLQMAARCVRAVRADEHPLLDDLLEQACDGRFTDAWALRDALVEVSGQVFGPPAYHPLPMPGWARR